MVNTFLQAASNSYDGATSPPAQMPGNANDTIFNIFTNPFVIGRFWVTIKFHHNGLNLDYYPGDKLLLLAFIGANPKGYSDPVSFSDPTIYSAPSKYSPVIPTHTGVQG